MAQPEHKEFFSKRGAIVEPMDSVLEDVMQCRRVSSRHPATVQAEVVLKVLVHNQSRIWAMEAESAGRPSPGPSATRAGAGGRAGDGASGGSGAGDCAAGPDNTLCFCSILDVSAWPPARVDAVLDFAIDLQATNWA